MKINIFTYYYTNNYGALLQAICLRNFLENQMMMMDGMNFQPVMIKSLIQHNGNATKQEIIQDLQNENPDLPKDHFDNSPVFKVLTNTHHVAQFNDSEKIY